MDIGGSLADNDMQKEREKESFYGSIAFLKAIKEMLDDYSATLFFHWSPVGERFVLCV